MKENNIAERIVELLSKHPEGLTTVDIARELGMHRHTVTKYIYQLVGSKKIHQRQVGPAKLCYLSKKGKG
jgi:DNA-binding IclR family transcriptional regulator